MVKKIYDWLLAGSYIFVSMSSYPHTKNYYTSIGDPDDVAGDGSEVLRLGICNRYVRYFVERKSSSTFVYYGDYALHSVSGDDALAEQLSNILSKDTFLSKVYNSVKVYWATDFEIIPAVFFDETEMAPDTAFQIILNGEANFIFEIPRVVNEVLQNKFSALTHYHSGASMIEVLRKEGLAKSDKLFINIQAGSDGRPGPLPAMRT